MCDKLTMSMPRLTKDDSSAFVFKLMKCFATQSTGLANQRGRSARHCCIDGSMIQWNGSTIQWNTNTIQWNASGD